MPEQMTERQFAEKMRRVAFSTSERIDALGEREEYDAAPKARLRDLWQEYRNINFRMPDAAGELVLGIAGFAALDLLHRWKIRYFEAVAAAELTEERIQSFQVEANRFHDELREELDSLIPPR